jgi:peptidase C13-like protein
MERGSDAAALWRGLMRNLLAGLRLAFFLRVRSLDFRISAGQFVALAIACLALWLVLGVVRQGVPGEIDSGALTAALAAVPLLLGVCLVAARLFGEAELAAAFAVVLLAGVPVFQIAGRVIDTLSELDAFEPYARTADWAFLAWAFAAVVRAQYVLTGWRGRRSALALVLFAALLAVLLEISPGAELWVAVGEDEADAGEQRLTQEEVFHRQGRLLDERLAALQPERHGVEDLYFVGVAADGGQDTFAAEVASIDELLDERFDTAGRSVMLINNPATLTEEPIATVSNLRATLARLGDVINTDEDVVLLHIASHGSSDYQLLVDLPPLELAQLTPSALARMLADSGIKWKIIVISACHSGGYIEPLRDENTLVITSADAARSSFGCNTDSDYTWFSEELYDEALRETFSFAEAFDTAKKAVRERELAEGYAQSNPQIAMGGAMREKLAALEKRLAAGFAPDPQKVRAIRVRTSDSSTVLVNGR